jgi:pimeloyl-ACP methyl ester carboxylesterase
MSVSSVAETVPAAQKPVHDPRAVALGQALFATLGAVSPALGGLVAERVFVRPRKHKPPMHEQEVRARADRAFTIAHEGLALDALSWGGGERVVLLAHGWEGRGPQMGRFVDPLVAAGFRVVAFDGPAHGRSPGKETDLLHYSRAIASAAAAVGPVHAVVGHSFGGAASMMAVTAGGFTPEKLVLVGSPASISYPLGQFRSVLDIPENIWGRFIQRMERRLGMSIAEATLNRDLPIPGMVIHCQDDTEVEFANAERIHAAWPSAQLVAVNGLGHRRILKDPKVIAAVTAFLSGDELFRKTTLANFDEIMARKGGAAPSEQDRLD